MYGVWSWVAEKTYSSDGTTVLRVADLSQQQRGCHLSKRVAETQDESTADVHWSDGQSHISTTQEEQEIFTYFPSRCRTP